MLTISSKHVNLEDSDIPIRMGELRPDRYACVSVSDAHHGMSQEIVDRPFEPFFTTKPPGKESGVRLAIVFGFFKQSDGTVRIYSELGYATTVSFYLPIVDGHHEIAEPIAPMEKNCDTGRTILVVDDEVYLIEIASSWLSEFGYAVLTAGGDPNAFTLLDQHFGHRYFDH
jgi:hypothetical protein